MMVTLLVSASVLVLGAASASAGQISSKGVTTMHADMARTFVLPPDSSVLYDQSASSGFAEYAVASWYNNSAFADYNTPDTAADDFVLPGAGTHTITAVYAPGVTDYVSWGDVIFFSKLKYSNKTGTATDVVKAICRQMPVQNQGGDLLVDVSSCDTGTFKAGHDYGVSVQGSSPGGIWYWQTNRKRINRSGLWWDYGGGGSGDCYSHLTPIKTCFPEKGYGPDLAFAIIGN